MRRGGRRYRGMPLPHPMLMPMMPIPMPHGWMPMPPGRGMVRGRGRGRGRGKNKTTLKVDSTPSTIQPSTNEEPEEVTLTNQQPSTSKASTNQQSPFIELDKEKTETKGTMSLENPNQSEGVDVSTLLQCKICEGMVARAIVVKCCESQACRACATRKVVGSRKCWSCSKELTTIDLINDDDLRLAVTLRKEKKGIPGDLLKRIMKRAGILEAQLTAAKANQVRTKRNQLSTEKPSNPSKPTAVTAKPTTAKSKAVTPSMSSGQAKKSGSGLVSHQPINQSKLNAPNTSKVINQPKAASPTVTNQTKIPNKGKTNKPDGKPEKQADVPGQTNVITIEDEVINPFETHTTKVYMALDVLHTDERNILQIGCCVGRSDKRFFAACLPPALAASLPAVLLNQFHFHYRQDWQRFVYVKEDGDNNTAPLKSMRPVFELLQHFLRGVRASLGLPITLDGSEQ